MLATVSQRVSLDSKKMLSEFRHSIQNKVLEVSLRVNTLEESQNTSLETGSKLTDSIESLKNNVSKKINQLSQNFDLQVSQVSAESFSVKNDWQKRYNQISDKCS